jgi:hypothetical protein
MSLVRVAAIRRAASMYGPGVQARLGKSWMAYSCGTLNFSCRYHATAPRCLGKTMFLFSACPRSMPLYAVVTDTVTPTRLRKERFEVALKLATFCNTDSEPTGFESQRCALHGGFHRKNCVCLGRRERGSGTVSRYRTDDGVTTYPAVGFILEYPNFFIL